MTGPSKRALVGHHSTEAIKHLTAVAELVRELRGSDETDDLALVVEGCIETVREVRREVEEAAR